MSRRGPCADCDPSTASTASVSSDLHKYHVACTCGGVAQYAECASVGPPEAPSPTSGPGSISTTKEPRPPALPPRPPPRPRPRNAQGGTARSDGVQSSGGSTTTSNVGGTASGSGGTGVGGGSGPKKYVWWCLGMGTTACLLGGLLLAAAMLLRAHTDSLHHLETIPTPVPASMLVATGLCIMSLARRRNRYSYLIKVVGACCLVCALTCVLVTITTTVIHMNRLQTLRKCVYTEKTRTCTCYSILADGQNTPDDEEGVKCVFESVMDCGTVHGALYRCLGAVFGLSVAGVLVCICSAMLAYQLLSHERKKMYWEQLELRCRSLYRPANNNNTGTNNNQQTNTHPQQPPVCDECCAECRAAAAVSWDIQHRFWATGRVGNLYSPNPGTGRRVTSWSWFPWPRNSNQRVGGSTSGDSAYGFGNTPAGYWQLGPPPPYTPHHRYLHHHIQQQQQQQANSLHHHHMGQGGAAPGAGGTGTLGSRHRGPQHARRGCDSHQHAPVPEDFSEELEEIHQHTCQKYQHAVPEQEEGVAIQGSENLAFQCEKQSPQRQARSGESELYFADVSSCCNVSLKAIDYCGGGLIGTIDSQADSSSVESDGQAHPHHRKAHHHPGHHGQGMGACSQSPRRSRIKNSNLQHADNRMHRPCEMNCRTNLMMSRGEVHYMDHTKEICQGVPAGYHCTDPECSQMLACVADDTNMRSMRRISENNEEMESPSMQCSLNGGMCQNSGNFNCHNTPDRSSMRVRQSPNRSSFICRQQSPIRANCVGLPTSTSSPNSFVPNESDNNFNSSQMRRRDSRDENVINYGGASSSLSQIRRRNDDDCDNVRRQNIEKELLGSLDSSCMSYKRKPIDENLLNEGGIDVHMRRQAIEDALLNNSLEMIDEGGLASIRRTALEDSILNCSVNQTITGLLNKSHEEQNDSQMMKRKAIDESMLCGEDVSFSPIRRKDLEDSLTKDQSLSMSPLRRRVLEDSINNELNISLSSMRRKAIEDSINNELSSSTPLRRKGDEQNISLSQIRKNKREDSMSSEELNVSAPRRKVNNDSMSNNINNSEQNTSMSPLRRRVLEEKINNDCANISLTRKAIEDLNNENQTKALDDLLNNDPNVMARRKGIDEILNSQLDNTMHNLKTNLSHIVQNDKYSPNFNNSMRDRELEDSLTSEVGGSRRGIIERACLGPDVRYEPVQVFGNVECGVVVNDDVGTQNPVHLRCCSDSNTMDSGWQSGSEKHITD